MKKSNLYFYQEYLVKKCLDDSLSRGLLILPTGSGKGKIARESFYRLITSEENKLNQFLGIVFTPRLLLNKQWLKDFVEYFKNEEHPINFVLIGSDRMGNSEKQEIIDLLYDIMGPGVDAPVSTLSYKELFKTVENNKGKGTNTLVISTYHSNLVVRSSNLYFDFAVYDEAHFLPGRENQRDLEKKDDKIHSAIEVLAKRKIFMTATPKEGKCQEGEEYGGRGTNNEEKYGPEILGPWKDEDGNERRTSPRDLIEFGSILSPLVHIISDSDLKDFDFNENFISNISLINPIKEGEKGEFEEKARITVEAFLEHKKEVKETSFSPDKIGAKMMVVCDGETDLNKMINSKVLKDFKEKNPNVKINSISCGSGVNIHGKESQNNNGKAKKEFLDNLKNILKTEEDAIIFHIDIMTVGIDCCGLTGVMFFKNSKLIKLLQNLGRACRLNDEDRDKWQKGELKPGGDGYIKPNFYVILPLCKENSKEFVSEFEETINNIRDEYSFGSSEFIRIGSGGRSKEVSNEDDNGPMTAIKSVKSEIDRIWNQKIEDKKKIAEDREILEETEKLIKWEENGEWDKIKEYMEGS